jgi:hypothetical protein
MCISILFRYVKVTTKTPKQTSLKAVSTNRRSTCGRRARREELFFHRGATQMTEHLA